MSFTDKRTQMAAEEMRLALCEMTHEDFAVIECRRPGKSYTGIVNRSRVMTPVIPAEKFVKEWEADAASCLGHILAAFEALDTDPAPITERLENFIFEEFKDDIVLAVLPLSTDEGYLDDCPFDPVIDDIVLYARVDMGGGNYLTVNNTILGRWGVDFSEVIEAGRKNAMKSARCIPVKEADMNLRWRGCMFPEEGSGTEIRYDPDMFMNLVTNKINRFGAALLCCPEYLKKIHEVTGDFHIIPSTVHELLILGPEGDPQDILKMVKLVNEEMVDDTDFLADAVYYFDGVAVTKAA